MRVGRTLPPVAVPMHPIMLLSGLSGMLRGQGEVERFRRELKTWTGLDECFLFSSGKAALTLALAAMKELHPGRDEVLIPAFTCYSVPSAIIRAGCKVKICDVSPEKFDFDDKQLSHKLRNRRLLAVIPCHLFGRPANISRIKALIDDPHVSIIEDAAQALGGYADGQRLGTLGDVGIFSLGRGKAFSTVAGGILVTRNKALAGLIHSRLEALPEMTARRQLTLLGYALVLMLFQRPSLYWLPRLLPRLKLGETIYDPEFSISRFSPFQAGLAKEWQTRLVWLQSRRRFLADQLLEATGLGSQPQFQPVNGHTVDWLRLPVVMASETARMRLLQMSLKRGLGAAASYPDAVSGISELALDFAEEESRNARWLARHLVTLPIHPYVGQRDIQRIASAFPALFPEENESKAGLAEATATY